MIMDLSKTSIRLRVYALVFLTLLGVIGVFYLAAHYISQSLFDARYDQSRKLVEAAHSLVQVMANEAIKNGRSNDEARRDALIFLRKMRYGANGYFWVNDLDGKFLLNPSIPLLENKNAIGLKDRDGREMIKAFIAIAKQRGEGRYAYFWPPNSSGKLKVSYIKSFPAWRWVIGSGVYVDDIEASVFEVEKKLAFAAFLMAIFAFSLAYLLGWTLSEPILSLNNTMQRLASGDLNIKIKELRFRDEIGSMARTVQTFQENLQRMAVLKTEQKDTDSMKNEFISVISHELRTPLTSIRGSLGLIANGAAGELPAKAQHLILIANKNCERLIHLINDILDIDKIAAGNMQFALQPESVNALLREAVQQNAAYAEKYFVRLQLTPLSKDVEINADAPRLQQVLANFLSNAAKFSPAGAKIDVSAIVQSGQVCICVKDYGLGIPNEFRSRIFKKFSQADSSSTRKKGGTGLGLYICKQVVEQMGGSIGYDLIKGLGSTFWIKIPIAPARLRSSAAEPAAQLV